MLFYERGTPVQASEWVSNTMLFCKHTKSFGDCVAPYDTSYRRILGALRTTRTRIVRARWPKRRNKLALQMAWLEPGMYKYVWRPAGERVGLRRDALLHARWS